MIRTLGAGMVLLAAGIYLCKDRVRIRQENETVEDILAAIESMETAVRWEKCPLPTSMQRQEDRKYVGNLFRKIHAKLESNMTLQEAWRDTFCRIKPERISEILCRISLSGDSIYLENRFSCAAKEIRNFQMQERERQAVSRKVKAAAAVSAASTIIILLL